MKKFFKIIGYILIGFLSLILLGVVILSVTGFPKPERIEARNIKKASFDQISDILGLMFYRPVFYELIRTEGDNVYFLKNGQPFIHQPDSLQTFPSEKHIPVTGMFGKVQYHNGAYYFLDENPNTEDKILLKADERSGKRDTLLVGAKGFFDFKISPDGRDIFAVDLVDKTGQIHLYHLANKPDGKPEIVMESEELFTIQGFGPDNSYVIISEVGVDGVVNYKKFDLQSRSSQIFGSGVDSTASYLCLTSRYTCNLQSFAEDFNTSYIIRTGHEGLSKEFNALWEVRGDSVRRVSPEMTADVNHLQLSPDERFVVFTANSGGFGKLYAYDRIENRVKTIYEGEEFNLDWYKYRPFLITKENQIFYSVSNFFGSRLLQTDLLSGETKVIDSAEQEDLKEVMKFNRFTYPTTDDSIGIMAGIEAYQYRPVKSEYEKMPVVIELHGGPEMPAFPFQFGMGSYFIKKGFTVISPNYRGSAGYGVSFASADDREKRLEQVKDIKALHNWIKTQPDLDADKVLLMGASHGGYMVMASLAQYPGDFIGGMSLAGVSDNSLVMHENSWQARGWKQEFGDFSDPQQKPILESSSPLYHADRITEPVFLIHGTADPRVVYQNSDKMADAIEAAGGQVQYIKLIGSGHAANPEGPLEAFYMMSATFDFIESLME